MDVKGQAAIVTGGGSGLGAATAESLAADGARVAVVDMNADAARAVARRIGGLALVGDVADAAAMEGAMAEARAAQGPARILVNCAGVAVAKRTVGRDGPMPLSEFERVIRVNLIGTFNMMRLAGAQMSLLEPMADGERGVIISTASIAAYEGQIGQAAYSASKGGVAALTLPVAREFAAFGVRVLAIAPGLFETPMLKALPEAAQQSLSASVPFPQRLGEPKEFAALVAHMVANRFLNGEVVRLDGSLRLPPR
jgi:NAD(P)-dependent dehydrogenase (short-subunit alcohol dehydrogenase family)